MILCCINRPNLIFAYSLLSLLLISSSMASRTHLMETPSSTKLKPTEYQRLAKYCMIEDYQAWLERQQQIHLWFDLAKLLRLPIHEDVEFQREFQRYRLQSECLRFFERLPVSVGPG